MSIRRWVDWAAGVALWVVSAQGAIFQIGPNGRPMRWDINQYQADLFPDQNPQTLAIRFRLSTEGWSAANRVNELDSIRAAFAQWQAVPGVRLKFEEAASFSGQSDVNPEDGRNMVLWLPGNRFINGGRTFFPALATGVTLISGTDLDETIAEADIVLNRSLEWFTDFDPDRISGNHVESVVLHEIGHFLGLNHSPSGGATLFWLTPPGLGSTAGLAAEEQAAVRALYPSGTFPSGTVRGAVTIGGAFLNGGVVTAEDADGRVVGSTVTRGGAGAYELAGLAPGALTLRVTPLDPTSTGSDGFLVSGKELDPYQHAYDTAPTDFLPRTNQAVTVVTGAAVTRNLTVDFGAPPFRITETRRFLTRDSRVSSDTCIQLRPGQSNVWVGVYVPNLPGTNASLRLTGAGLTYGPTEVVTNALRKMPLVQVPVTVAADALPGLRSITVATEGYTAWANGFAEVLPSVYDFNFDGFDDGFQRRYFSPFTRPEAGPEADPDGDGFVNRREAVMNSDPTLKSSVNYRITSVMLTVNGTTVVWESAPGHRYQVRSRDRIDGAVWQSVGGPVTAAGETAQVVDGRVTDPTRFYRVEDAP